LNPVNQPLLDNAEVTALITQASGWQGLAFAWKSRPRLQGHSGPMASQQAGSGLDFVESRPYQPGDEPRHIDWRATARTGTPFVRIFHEELAPSVFFIIDRRTSMRFGTRRRLKATQAGRLAIFLATHEIRQGAEVGAVVVDETIQWIPAVSGLRGVERIAQVCRAPCPPLDPTDPASHSGKPMQFGRLLNQVSGRLPNGSTLYLLSDFSDISDNDLPTLSRMGHEHTIHALNIFDAAEQQLPRAGRLALHWQGRRQTVDSHSKAVQSTFSAHSQQRMDGLQALFNRCDCRLDHLPARVDALGEWLMALAS